MGDAGGSGGAAVGGRAVETGAGLAAAARGLSSTIFSDAGRWTGAAGVRRLPTSNSIISITEST